MKQRVTLLIDFFYPFFRRFMPLQTFRYAVCGGINTVLGLLLYSLCYTYALHGEDLQVGYMAFKPHTASLLMSFVFNFSLGFLLNKYVVFISSNLKGRIQLFRYFLSFVSNLGLNYLMLKFFVEMLFWNAIFSQVLTTCIVVAVSYFSQKHFSFKANTDIS
jgi:putative flippase GtrA